MTPRARLIVSLAVVVIWLGALVAALIGGATGQLWGLWLTLAVLAVGGAHQVVWWWRASRRRGTPRGAHLARTPEG